MCIVATGRSCEEEGGGNERIPAFGFAGMRACQQIIDKLGVGIMLPKGAPPTTDGPECAR